MHGPKSVLCTQALPTRCNQCEPFSPRLRSKSSENSFDTDATTAKDSPILTHDFQRKGSDDQIPQGLSRTSTAIDSVPPTPSIEQTPYYVNPKAAEHTRPNHSNSNPQNDTCASCTFTVPENITKQIPAGAPGSPRLNGPGSNGSPILRTRQLAPSCNFEHSFDTTFTDPEDRHCAHSDGSSGAGSIHSSTTTSSDNGCHLHEINYLTVRAPKDPTEYAMLRASVIRTLSSEMLPRGLSSGPIVVGDSTNGFTIAHIFRLPDPKARGRRRSYAFIALAGSDGQRAFRAFSVIEAAFQRLADQLIRSAEQHQEQERLQEERAEEIGNQNRKYTPISSFLTQRVVDPDGYARRFGQTVPRSLAEITGNPKIFAQIHAEFCLTLCILGKRLKMLPKNQSLTYETLISNDEGRHRAFRSQIDRRNSNGLGLKVVQTAEVDNLRDHDVTPTPSKPKADVEAALARMSIKTHADPQSHPSSANTSPNQTHPLVLEAQRKQVMV